MDILLVIRVNARACCFGVKKDVNSKSSCQTMNENESLSKNNVCGYQTYATQMCKKRNKMQWIEWNTKKHWKKAELNGKNPIQSL